jgi:hypothetical protein
MTTIESAATTIREPGAGFEFDEAQRAAVSFLARYKPRARRVDDRPPQAAAPKCDSAGRRDARYESRLPR